MCPPIKSCNLTLTLNKAVFSLGNSPIITMTSEVQGQENMIILDLIREPGPESGWLNRSCRNPRCPLLSYEDLFGRANNTNPLNVPRSCNYHIPPYHFIRLENSYRYLRVITLLILGLAIFLAQP